MKKKISIAAVCVVIITVIAVVLVQHNTSKKTLQDVFPSLDNTVSIELRSQNVPDYPIVTCTITDPQQVQNIVARIKNTPIHSQKKVRIVDGWTFIIILYDADGNDLLGGSFGSNYLTAPYNDNCDIVYTFNGDDFQFLTDLADSGEPME